MMSFAIDSQKSNASLRYLFTVDISRVNLQWINIGAGVWYCSFTNTYTYVDASLLSDEYTAQSFGDIGSLTVDAEIYAKASALSYCASTDASFYYDGTNRAIYVHTKYNDSPYLHKVKIGIVEGYSNRGFTPVGASTYYDGRLARAPSVSKKRDPLFWGKIQFDIGNVELINSDGALDEFAKDNDVYGNAARVYYGYAGNDISEYKLLYSGTMETFNYDYETASFKIADKRKTLSRPAQNGFIDTNGIDAIINEITMSYGDIFFTDEQFDTQAFIDAKPYAPKINLSDFDGKTIIDIVQEICATIRGIFIVLPDGRYSFNYIDPGKAHSAVIPYEDIIGRVEYAYDPSEIVSSVKVGYLPSPYSGTYTYYTDNSREADIYDKYKGYKEQTFETLLTSLADAQAFASEILDYCQDVHATMTLKLPMKYYYLELGDMVYLEHGRKGDVNKKVELCEILGIAPSLDSLSISFTMRKYDSQLCARVLSDGSYRITTDNYIRGVIA